MLNVQLTGKNNMVSLKSIQIYACVLSFEPHFINGNCNLLFSNTYDQWPLPFVCASLMFQWKFLWHVFIIYAYIALKMSVGQ